MIKSFSKVNLFLKVLKKNRDKLHNIQSNTVLINLYDQIEIKKINYFSAIVSKPPFTI